MKTLPRSFASGLVYLLFTISLFAAAETLKNLLLPTAQTTSWQFEEIDNAKGALKIEDGAVALTVSKVDGTDWHVQFYQLGLDLKEGKEYVVTFQAKASAKRSSQVYAGVNEDDYHAVGLDEVIDLTPEWRNFKFTFKTDGVVVKNNRLGFLVGQETGTVWIKDVVMAATGK